MKEILKREYQISKKVIVAIDFGTSGTSYSYAFTDCKEDILTPEEIKKPTEIILDSQKNI